MENKFVFKIQSDFDYYPIDFFTTSKLSGAVEIKKAGLLGVESYFISQRIYYYWKKHKKFPQELSDELESPKNKLIKNNHTMTLRTCFRFSGYENPRAMPAYRSLRTTADILNSMEEMYISAEDTAKKNGIDWFDLGFILMRRIDAAKAGFIIVSFKDQICQIDACWNDIHLIASGDNDFDSFWLRSDASLVEKQIRKKLKRFVCGNNNANVEMDVPMSMRDVSCLTDKEISTLARQGFKTAEHFNSSVEIEFMIDEDGTFDLYEVHKKKEIHLNIFDGQEFTESQNNNYLVKGISVNPGLKKGFVRIIKNIEDLNSSSSGEIIVLPAELMGKDIPILFKAEALITDSGGITSHISTVAKELNIPMISGTGNASKVLEDGQEVILDATKGLVYAVTLNQKNIFWLHDEIPSMQEVGAKGYNLMRLSHQNINVPDAFVISTEIFKKFFDDNNLSQHLYGLNKTSDIENLGKFEEQIKEKIMSGKFDSNLKTEIIEAFATLKSKFGAVSVRSSATCEDSKNASFAGQFETYLFVNDQKTLIDYVKKCWASFFRSGAILYAMNHGIDLSKSQMAVVVQGMINSDVAGVMFTKNNGNAGVVIEAAKGVGENVVSGNVKPDEYEINPDSFRIKSEIKQNQRLLSNPEIVSLTALGIKIEKLFNFPQDIEWAIQNKAVYILQTRPITV